MPMTMLTPYIARSASLLHGGILAFAVLLFSACAEDKNPPPTAIAAKSAEQMQNADFRIVSAKSDAFEGESALQIDASEAFASEQDFNAAISVLDGKNLSVDGSWQLSYRDANRLYFKGITAGTDYKVTVNAGLVSASGKEIKQRFEQNISSVQQPPTMGFAGQGSLLPSKASQGLPIRTVNVDAVQVDFMRVRPESVPRVLSGYAFRGRTSGWSLNDITDYAEAVYGNQFSIDDDRPNTQIVSYLPIQGIKELQAPGLYFAIMKKPGDFSNEFEVTHYMVSDLALHVRRYGAQTLVLSRSLSTGLALPNTKLTLLSKFGEPLAQGETDANGQALLSAAPDNSMVLLGESDKELTALPFSQPALDLSEYPINGQTADANTIFIWSGRDLYRPGELVRLSGLLRDFDGKPVPDRPIYASLKQPDGKTYASLTLNPGKLGYVEWQRTLPADVPTGRWAAEFSTDPEGKGRAHRFEFKIEEFLPERLKLDLTSPQTRLLAGETLTLDVAGAYLYGAPANGNRFSAKYNLSAASEAIPSMPGYRFGDLVNLPKPELVEIADQTLDAEGKLQTTIAVDKTLVTGPIAINIAGSVFETGGRATTRGFKRVIWPAEQVLGVRPLFADDDAGSNSLAAFEIQRADLDGKSLTGSVSVKLIRERRDYRWSYNSGSGWVADFTSSFSETPVQTVALDGKTAKKIEFPVEWGDYRIELTDSATGLVTRYPFHAGWSWGSDNLGPDARPDKVKLAMDKSAYKVGDTVELTITPPNSGEGLLLIESDHLLESRPFTVKDSVTLDVTIKPEWDRHDVYFSAMVFKPGSNTEFITPKRALGMMHLPMDRSARQLEVKLTAPAKILPERDLEVRVQVPALKGKTASVSLHAVDQGITNITRFEVPNPFKHFFAQRAFAIDLYDVYGRVIEALEGNAARFRFGGDAGISELPQAARKTAKVQTIDLFSGQVALDANGEAVVKLPVPDFNGSLKVSALVYSDDRFGLSAAETIVRAPIVVEASLPRVLAPGDVSKLSIDVQNFTGKTGEFNVSAKSDAGLTLVGGSRTITLQDLEKQTLSFDISAGRIGIAAVSVSLSGNGAKFSRNFETVVRPAWGDQRSTRFESLSNSKGIDLSVSSAGFYADTVRSRVSLSNRAPIPVAEAAKELFDYPYGCIEQTSSRLLPFVTLDDAALVKLGMSPIDPKRRKDSVNAGLGRLASMQSQNGHFNYWPGTDYVEVLFTPLVAELLLDAQAQGYDLPPQTLQKALERLKTDLLSGGEVNYDRVFLDNADHLRFSYNAHAAFVLAKVKQAPLGSLRTLYDGANAKSLSPLPLVRIGLALKAAGDQKRGDAALAQAFGARWVYPKDRWLADYGSEMRDQALALALALEADALPKGQESKLLEIAYQARAKDYFSTQERATLVRLAKSMARGPDRLEGTLIVGANREPFATSGLFARDLSMADLNAGAKIELSAPQVYLLQQTAGIPRTAPAVRADPVSITRAYFNIDGTRFSGNQIAEGEQLVVRLTIESKIWMPDALVVDLLPGGLEAENLNLVPTEQLAAIEIDGIKVSDARSELYPRTEEFRDDRYVVALNLREGKTMAYYVARAVSPGNFVVPPPMMEDMYRPELQAIGVSIPERIEVSGGVNR